MDENNNNDFEMFDDFDDLDVDELLSMDDDEEFMDSLENDLMEEEEEEEDSYSEDQIEDIGALALSKLKDLEGEDEEVASLSLWDDEDEEDDEDKDDNEDETSITEDIEEESETIDERVDNAPDDSENETAITEDIDEQIEITEEPVDNAPEDSIDSSSDSEPKDKDSEDIGDFFDSEDKTINDTEQIKESTIILEDDLDANEDTTENTPIEESLESTNDIDSGADTLIEKDLVAEEDELDDSPTDSDNQSIEMTSDKNIEVEIEQISSQLLSDLREKIDIDNSKIVQMFENSDMLSKRIIEKLDESGDSTPDTSILSRIEDIEKHLIAIRSMGNTPAPESIKHNEVVVDDVDFDKLLSNAENSIREIESTISKPDVDKLGVLFQREGDLVKFKSLLSKQEIELSLVISKIKSKFLTEMKLMTRMNTALDKKNTVLEDENYRLVEENKMILSSSLNPDNSAAVLKLSEVNSKLLLKIKNLEDAVAAKEDFPFQNKLVDFLQNRKK